MVESITELKKICQEGRTVKGRSGEHWITLKFNRKISIYLTKAFLYTPITANQVSVLSFFVALFGASLLLFGNYWYALLSALLFYLVEILDSVDGEIARYRKSMGKQGEFTEAMIGKFFHPLYFIGLTGGLYLATNSLLVIIFGISSLLFYLQLHILNELRGEYETKTFHASATHTLKRVTTSPLKLFNFLVTSKHFRHFFFLIMALANSLFYFLAFYGILLPLAFLIIFVQSYLGFKGR